MRLALERDVPLEERHKAALGSLADWDAARIFLEVVRRGSFRSAFPNIIVDLQCAMRSADVSRHEAEVAIHSEGE